MDKALAIIVLLCFFCSPSICNQFVGGDGFIQFGTFRIGNVDNTHFSVSSISGPNGGKTVIIFRNDGTVHPGPRDDFDLDSRPILTSPTNVKFTNNGIEFGEYWCLGMSENDISDGFDHLSITHNNKHTDGIHRTAMIWRNDGTRHPGPRRDFSCWSSTANNAVTFGADKTYAQFNNAYRIGTTGKGGVWEHMSIASDRTCVIYRDDGTIHPGPRSDWNWPGWVPDHKECPDCNDYDGCTIDKCDWSTGKAKCINVPKVCPGDTVCNKDNGQCVNFCDTLAIDKHLTQCSTEFPALKQTVADISDGLELISKRRNKRNGGSSAQTEGMNNNLIDNNNGDYYNGNYVKSRYFNQYTDEIIVGLLLLNLMTMIIMGTCYVHSKKENNKKYYAVNMQESDDEERALKN